MENIYIIINLDIKRENKYLSPWRGNGQGQFLWDYKRYAFLFDDDTIEDDAVLSFLDGVNYSIIQVSNSEYEHNNYY